MNSNYRFRYFLLSLAVLLITGGACSSSGSSGAGSSCVSIPDGQVAWTVEICGPLTNGQTVDINQATQGQKADGGAEALGERAVNKGRVTWTVTNMDWSDFPWPLAEGNDVVVSVFMAYGKYFREANWHILGNRFAYDSKIETRLVNQRFDLTCIGGDPQDCEWKYTAFDLPKYLRASTYKFDCSWDTTVPSMLYGRGADLIDGLVECKILDVSGGGENLIETYRVPTSGPYNSLKYFTVGGNTSGQEGHPGANLPTTLTNVRFTIFAN
ncbi:MAG: hypothetical protein OEZ55_09740 [Nitrospinota bacterium]|nr:hypothetical protein [Nitrospinota bacterium]